MSPRTQQVAMMFDMLPEHEQELAYETLKRFVMAWDPEFTKVTPEERNSIEHAEKSGFIPEDEIDWNDLSKYV